MKFDVLTLRELRMPLVHFFETSFGRTTERRVLLVTLLGDGLVGWGGYVACQDPFYSPEAVETAWYAITEHLAPMLLGKEIAAGKDCPGLFARVRGHRMAKAALEDAVRSEERRVGK